MFKFLIKGTMPDIKPKKINGKWGGSVYPIPAAFDIETTNDKETKSAYMYHWQFALADNVIAGRTWDEFFDFLHWLTQAAYLSEGKLIVFIHNMSFEMSFLLPQIYARGLLDSIFAKEEREPIEVRLKNGIIFRDTMALTNMSLAALAKNYTKTQKLVGDLDYSIPRNSQTPLTEKELEYCINDVLILKEYAEQLHEEYTMKGRKIPMTSTGIVRQYVREQIPKKKKYAINKSIEKLYPKTVEQYNYTMRWLFRGGYTHANTAQCNKILENVISYDFTSAYPSIMIHKFFPMSPFKPLSPDKWNEKDITRLVDHGRCVIFMADFYGIETTTYHCVESRHKLIDFSNDAIFENGRLYSAGHIRVLLTDVDYNIYRDFYKWEKMEIVSAKTAHRGQLPDYLYNAVLEFYKGKKVLKEQIKTMKRAGVDTTDAQKLLQKIKGMLNSCYGMTVSRLNFGEIRYGEHTDAETGETVVGYYEDEGKEYSEMKAEQILSPYWGIYVTAYCRQNILRAIKHFDKYAVYSDTDSIKILSTAPGIEEFFSEYNEKIRTRNETICETFELDPLIYSDLGTFDCEGTYTRFKTLGAKRYLYELDGVVEAVVAGLPKSVSKNYAKEHGNDELFKFFSNGMFFEYADKHAHQYTGECSAVIAGELMHELGSCYIFETSFKMSIESLFMTQIHEREALLK